MRIFFFTLSKVQNLKDKGIYVDMIKEFLRKGNTVDYFFPSEKTTIMRGINFSLNALRINLKIQKTLNFFTKFYSYIVLEKEICKKIKKTKLDYDLLLISTPSIFQLKIVSNFRKKFPNAKVVLLLKDIFPDNAVDLGILNDSFFHKLAFSYFKKIENKLYHSVNKIGVMTEFNKDYILNKYPFFKEKIFISPNSIMPYKFTYLIDRKKYGLPKNKTIITFIGNIGLPQDPILIKNLITQAPSHFHFLVIGSGSHYNTFKDLPIDKLTLINKNLTQDKIYKYLINSDYGLVSLSSNFLVPNFPSKILTYLNAKLPIIAFTNFYNDLRYLINDKLIIGYWENSSDFNSCLTTLLKIKEKPKKTNHPIFKDYHVKNQVSKILNLVEG